MLRKLTDEDRTAFLNAVEGDPASWPILRLARGHARLHLYYTEAPDPGAALRAELDGAEVYHRTFAVAVSAQQTAAELRAEVGRFRREYKEQGWDELPPFLRLQDEA